MKIPAVAIAAAFLSGILLGLRGLPGASHRMLVALLCCFLATILFGFLSCIKDYLTIGAIGSLAAWDSGAANGHDLKVSCYVACPAALEALSGKDDPHH
jgi:hypothetical protein